MSASVVPDIQTSNEGERPERIQRKRTAGWRMPDGAVYVGRPSRWGNPFPVAELGLDLSLALFNNTVHGIFAPNLLEHLNDVDFRRVIDLHHAWLKRLNWSHPTEAARYELAGHDLACWCALDAPCHGDVLLSIANPGPLGRAQ